MFRRARPGAPEGNVGGCGRAGEARLHVIGAEEAFRALPGGGAPDARWGFLRKLRDLGRQAAGRWLDENLAAVGGAPDAGARPVRRPVVELRAEDGRPPRAAERIAQVLGGVLVPLGSAGAKAMAVVQGDADVYAHAGGQYEWDSAAPVAVAQAAGLHTSRLDGSPLVYNQPDPYLPDLLICRPELAGALLAAIDRITAA